jgi:hypothetical protein
MKINKKNLKKIIKEEYKRIKMEQMIRQEPGALGAMDDDQLLAMLQATECPHAREEIELELNGRAMGHEEPEWQNPRWQRTGANWER